MSPRENRLEFLLTSMPRQWTDLIDYFENMSYMQFSRSWRAVLMAVRVDGEDSGQCPHRTMAWLLNYVSARYRYEELRTLKLIEKMQSGKNLTHAESREVKQRLRMLKRNSEKKLDDQMKAMNILLREHGT